MPLDPQRATEISLIGSAERLLADANDRDAAVDEEDSWTR